MIKKQWDNGALIIPEKWIGIDFPSLKIKLYEKNWNVNSRPNFAAPDRVEAERFIPVLEGLNAYEVYREITGCDLSVCPKCKQGRMTNSMSPNLREAG